MIHLYTKVRNCYESVRQKTGFVPEVAIVLGSGLGDYAEEIRVEYELPYGEIEQFPVSTVPGHAGKFIFGYIDEIPVACMKGRVHYYEGYSAAEIGKILGKKENTVYSLLSRARGILKEKLGGEEIDG